MLDRRAINEIDAGVEQDRIKKVLGFNGGFVFDVFIDADAHVASVSV